MPPKGFEILPSVSEYSANKQRSSVATLKRKAPYYTQQEDDIIIAGRKENITWAKIAEQVDHHNATNDTGITRSSLSNRQRWMKYLSQSQGPGAEDSARDAGEEQDEDTVAREEEAEQSGAEVVDEEESNQADLPQLGRIGLLAFRVELQRATNRHNREMESLREQGIEVDEEPQILREASLEREIKRYAEEKRSRREDGRG